MSEASRTSPECWYVPLLNDETNPRSTEFPVFPSPIYISGSFTTRSEVFTVVVVPLTVRFPDRVKSVIDKVFVFFQTPNVESYLRTSSFATVEIATLCSS